MVTAAAWKPFLAGTMMKETRVSGSVGGQLVSLLQENVVSIKEGVVRQWGVERI